MPYIPFSIQQTAADAFAVRRCFFVHCNRRLRNRQGTLIDNPAALCYDGRRIEAGGETMTLGERLIQLRAKAGLNQDTLSLIHIWREHPSVDVADQSRHLLFGKQQVESALRQGVVRCV